ncbi:hypothetical protein COOONC_12474 [Cooperia oncophora]
MNIAFGRGRGKKKDGKEMNSVFAVYGIEVSKRHLSLTADYMTFTGQIAPFNRGAMSASSSPLQKMTFETTMAFMKESLLHGLTRFRYKCFP